MATTYSVAQPAALPQRRLLTVEQALYLLIGVLAFLGHLYLLSGRALHHDETLHAEYSWRIYTGQGYTHDPLLHGPFLYYFTALMYFLFGDTNATARLGAALFGAAAVLLPVLLRREMGRAATLLACGYLLISPVFLYVGRFIRHDIFAITFELLAVIALVRYIHSERPGWHYLFAAALGLMLATMETFYLFMAILGSFVVVALLWEVSRKSIGLIAAYAALAALALRGLPALGITGPLPLPTEAQALDVRHQPDNNWAAYFEKLGPVLGPLLSHPAILLVIGLTLALTVVLGWQLWGVRDSAGRSRWRGAADRAAPGSLLRAVDRVPARQWLWAILIATAIYAVFYTAIISNPARPNSTGLITGVLGSFLYWLGQHGVRRGGQPDHYYLFQLAIYEPLLLIFGPVGIVLVLRRALQTLRSRPAEPETPDFIAETAGASRDADGQRGRSWRRRLQAVAPRIEGYTAVGAASPPSTEVADPLPEEQAFLPGLLAWWSVFALVIYSWAGEKMPWLTIHIVLPLALLGAWALSRLLAYALRDGVMWSTWIVGGTAVVVIGTALQMLNLTAMSSQRVNQVAIWPLLIVVFIGLLVLGATLLGGVRQGLFAGVGIMLLLLVPLTIRSALRLAYVNGDVPVEPMVYVQTAPDVRRVMLDLERAALLTGKREALPIRYDNETVWQWYLRDYTATEGSGGEVISTITEDVQAVFLLQENVPAHEPQLEEFVRQRYPLRWWFPECEVYRFPARDKECGPNPAASSLLGRFLSRPWSGEAISEMWQFVIYRRLPSPLGSADWTFFVRPELAHVFGLGGMPNP